MKSLKPTKTVLLRGQLKLTI